MKIVIPSQMTHLESVAYQTGSKETDFMENAGYGIFLAIKEYIQQHQLNPRILLLCGKGNNTGDGFVACSYLLEEGFDVWALQPVDLKECSELCQINCKRFEAKGGILIQNFENCSQPSLIIDGIFGTGFKGLVRDPFLKIIQQANQSKIPILAIDIPSGLDGATGNIQGEAIQATETLFLGLPKKGFFFNQGWNVVGKLKGVDFGLPKTLIENAPTNYQLLTSEEMFSLLPPLKRTRHKYQAGFVIGIAGSPSMPGAASLASLAALKSGSGIVKLFYPQGMETQLLNSPYELIKISYQPNDLTEILNELKKANSCFIGPGLGRTEVVKKMLENLIPQLHHPCVLDADALFFLANDVFQSPLKAILTPHLGEMQKLLHSDTRLTLNEELLEICQSYVEKHQVTLVLKGSPTFILHPNSPISICSLGDPGMATAGSGDVLTGLIAALLSQGLTSQEAAQLGVYLHGCAGEYAAYHLTSYSLIASDLIANLSNAFQFVMKNK